MRRMIAVVAVLSVAILFARWTDLETLLLCTSVPVCGAVIQRLRGGAEVIGGFIGGVATAFGYCAYCYLRAYLSPEGLTTQLVWPGVLELFVLFIFTIDGVVVGFLVWVAMGDWE